jgi:hypothetical protein
MVQLVGAAAFGALIGWFVYYINRYRTGGVQFSDLVTLIGVLGGAAILALFPSGTDLFGAYGIGLAVGFFGYLLVLAGLVANSENFDGDWFLDGRRKRVIEPWWVPGEVRGTVAAMGLEPGGDGGNGAAPEPKPAATPVVTRRRSR